MGGCALSQPRSTAGRPADGYFDLGGFHRPITTDVADAQKWFDRGLILTYGFNHEEAIRCFEKATEADPECAMAWWGIAHASGPYINGPTPDEAANRRAAAASARALALREGLTEVERGLVDSLADRFHDPAPEDRTALDRAYADAMRRLHQRFPADDDLAALFAESLMVLSPWNHWTPDGEPRPGTDETRAVLETVLRRNPSHPAACHFYIHLMEASPWPGLARDASDRLRDRIPEAGHLVHMPAHIDIQIGRYADSVRANQKAIAADALFVAKRGRMNMFTLYRVHNYHFLVFGAMFSGERAVAIEAAEELVREVPRELVAQMPEMLEAFLPTIYHALVRFGEWERIIAQPEPPAEDHFSKAIRHYARTIAFASLRRVDEGAAEYEALKQAVKAVPESHHLFENTCSDILAIALLMAEGELEYRRGNFDRAFALLRQGVERDDHLKYDEPWGWMQPVRHALGALLLEQGRVDEAEQVYRADLVRYPENGWSLHGLAECLERQGRRDEAIAVRARFERAWQSADIELTSSCFCRLSACCAGKSSAAQSPAAQPSVEPASK